MSGILRDDAQISGDGVLYSSRSTLEMKAMLNTCTNYYRNIILNRERCIRTRSCYAEHVNHHFDGKVV